MIASPQKRFVVFLDSSLLVIFILLLSPRLTGLPLHEILGFVFFIPILLHLLIAWPWIRKATRKLFQTVNLRTRINFVLNVVLFILVITELVSGIVISEIVLPGFNIATINDRSWRALHNLPLNFVVVFTGFHIAMNWGWIVSAVNKRRVDQKPGTILFSAGIKPKSKRVAILILAAAVVALMWYSIIGKPNLARLYSQNEIARFIPSIDHGLIQLFGEAFLIVVIAFIARKWLKIRL